VCRRIGADSTAKSRALSPAGIRMIMMIMLFDDTVLRFWLWGIGQSILSGCRSRGRRHRVGRGPDAAKSVTRQLAMVMPAATRATDRLEQVLELKPQVSCRPLAIRPLPIRPGGVEIWLRALRAFDWTLADGALRAQLIEEAGRGAGHITIPQALWQDLTGCCPLRERV